MKTNGKWLKVKTRAPWLDVVMEQPKISNWKRNREERKKIFVELFCRVGHNLSGVNLYWNKLWDNSTEVNLKEHK